MAGDEAAIGIVGKGNLPWNGQLTSSGSGVNRFVIGDAFQLEVLTGAAEGALLTHHGGGAIGFLAFGSLLLAGLLPVFKAAQFLVKLVAGAFLQWDTP